jgi:hypothetical protein
MSGLVRKSLDAPEETRPFEAGTGQLELVNLEGGPVGRATLEPGWQWSKHVKPIAKTESCQAAHTVDRLLERRWQYLGRRLTSPMELSKPMGWEVGS